MSRSPDLDKKKTIFDLVAEQRKPPKLVDNAWYRIGVSQSHGIGFTNSWDNLGGSTSAPAGWYLSDDGEVRLRGKITGGSAGTTVFILPEEVRPEFAETWICAVDGGGTANVTVWPDGSLTVDNFNL